VSSATTAAPPRGSTDSIAVVVPCRNEARSIEGLLAGLLAQTRLPDRVVVVNDGSTDDTAAIVERWAGRHPALRVDVVATTTRGAGAAMNRGIASTRADVIVRLDGHCMPSPGYVAIGARALAATGAGVVGGVWKIEPGSNSMTARGIAAVLSHPLGSGGADYRRAPGVGEPAEARPVDTVPFGIFRREVWAEVGGFDEALLRNQDYDFNYRVRLAGRAVILDPSIVSTYWARPTLGALARQYFGYGQWKVIMLRKFPRSIRARQLLPLLLLPVVTGLLVAAAVSRSLLPLAGIVVYLFANVAGALQASLRAGDIRLTPFAAAALLVLQNAWSAGACVSLLKAARDR
jgi:glycosyltransferase involved in cell wall biosynthesis